MLQRCALRLLLGLLLVLSLCSACASARAKVYDWQRIDSDVQVQESGTLNVSETITLRYSGGPFTFAFRDLPNRRLDSISAIQVTDSEHNYRQVNDKNSKEPYTFSVFRQNNTQRVRWVYPGTTGGTRTFTLRYLVGGAVRRFDTFDAISWSMVFPNRDSAVEQASGRISLPSAVPAAQLLAFTPAIPGEIRLAPGVVSVSGQNIPPNEELALEVHFPKNLTSGAKPAWQATQEAQEVYNATTRSLVNQVLAGLSLLVFMLLAFVVWGWWQRHRDPQASGFPGGELSERPDDLPPALAATLLGGSAGAALMGTLFDLANSGHLTLHEKPAGWGGRSRQLTLERTDKAEDDLQPFERDMMALLFSKGSPVVLKEESRTIVKALPGLEKQARALLMARGYLDDNHWRGRNRGVILSIILMIVSMAALIPAGIVAERYSYWLPVLAAVVFGLSTLWLIVASLVRGVTPDGAQALARWKAFQRFLKHLKPETTLSGQFDRLLPYAVAIGSADRFVKAYSRTSEALPSWYYPLVASSGHSQSGGIGGMNRLSSHNSLMLSDFSQGFLSGLSSASSSTGASSGSAGAGGGASGGGGGGAG